MSDKCPKCGHDTRCLAGHSAHPDNWYCTNCDWKAWERPAPRREPSKCPYVTSSNEGTHWCKLSHRNAEDFDALVAALERSDNALAVAQDWVTSRRSANLRVVRSGNRALLSRIRGGE